MCVCSPQQMLLNSLGGIKECFLFICQSDYNSTCECPWYVQVRSRDVHMEMNIPCVLGQLDLLHGEKSISLPLKSNRHFSLTALLLIESQVER